MRTPNRDHSSPTARQKLLAVMIAATAATTMLAGPANAAKKTVRKPTTSLKKSKIPLPGSPCTERGVNFPATALDCVNVPGKGLQWRIRGTVRNPFRLGEAVEVYSLESSRYRVALTDWDPDVTEESKAQGVDPSVPGVAFLEWRTSSTLLASGGARAANRANEANVPLAFVVTAGTRENSSRSLVGFQPDLVACRNGGLVKDGFPPPSGKGNLDHLEVGESGWSQFCKEAPADQVQNVVVELLNAFNAPGGPNAKTAVTYYFTGTPR